MTKLYLVVAVLLASTQVQAREWKFDVLLDDKPIGQHSFVLQQDSPQATLLTSTANFKVKFLFINAYDYSHVARETWQNGCLTHLDTETRENSDKTQVRGQLSGSHFQLSGPQGTQKLPECVMTFAYWNPAILKQNKLLNPQTGEWLDVRVQKMGSENLQLHDQVVQAERYKLQAPKVNLDLWYTQEKEWVALRSTTPDGYVINYKLR